MQITRRFLAVSMALSACGLYPALVSGGIFHHRKSCESCGPCAEVVEREVACKVCKPVPDVKKSTKTVYSCKEETICATKCPSLLHGKHGCGDCNACANCEKPRSRRVLIKKFVVEEHPTTKCVVDTVTERVPCTVSR